MKHIVIAMDSFKGSLRSMEAGEAAARGIRRVWPDASVFVSTAADGGEGTMEALVDGLCGEIVSVTVSGPQGRPVCAQYGVVREKKLAIMEMAQAAGITLVDRDARDPYTAATYGVGEMIAHAIERGCREFIIGIGGSATTDGGVGMLSALGFSFLDAEGKQIAPGAQALDQICTISDADVLPELRDCRFRVACDVNNPLLGENGAVFVYGEQKGVKESEKQLFDDKMAHYANKAAAFSGKDMRMQAGAGAAGGMGFAFLSFLHAQLEPGISLVLSVLQLEEAISRADIVVTGEGRLDEQSARGKVPVGVARLAKKYGCIVLAFAGGVTDGAKICNEMGIDAYFPVVRGVTDLEHAMQPEIAAHNIEETVEQVFRLLK